MIAFATRTAAIAAAASLVGFGVATVTHDDPLSKEVAVVPDVCVDALTAADDALLNPNGSGVAASMTAYTEARDICRVQAGDNR